MFPKYLYCRYVKSRAFLGKGLSHIQQYFRHSPSGWFSGEHVGLMTWWLCVRSPVEANFLSGVFSPLTFAEACGKNSRWLWKEKLSVCVTDRHDMTLAFKVALNTNTYNQPNKFQSYHTDSKHFHVFLPLRCLAQGHSLKKKKKNVSTYARTRGYQVSSSTFSPAGTIEDHENDILQVWKRL